MKDLSLSTIAVHGGRVKNPGDYTPITTPIHNAVTYTYPDMHVLDEVFAGTQSGYVYTRYGNPTTAALEAAVASLEGTDAAVSCATGMAATHLALLSAGIESGTTLLTAEDVYGGTHALLAQVLSRQGVRVEAVDMTHVDAVEKAIARTRPTAMWVETISNPLLKVADIAVLAELAHKAGALLLVDNTFATPFVYRPALHGADCVLESGTKYLGGHGDVMAGILGASAEFCKKARDLQKLLGAILGPNEGYLVLRGLRTLHLRMRQQCANAALVARFLSSHPRVARVYYPGLPSSPSYPLARSMFASDYFGAMVSFEMAGGDQESIFHFMDTLQLVAPATSLGDVYSLVMYPAHASHRALTQEERHHLGIGNNLVRLSIGVEEGADIVADLAQALEGAGRSA